VDAEQVAVLAVAVTGGMITKTSIGLRYLGGMQSPGHPTMEWVSTTLSRMVWRTMTMTITMTI
jgi:hypothetical protein